MLNRYYNLDKVKAILNRLSIFRFKCDHKYNVFVANNGERIRICNKCGKFKRYGTE